MPQHREVNLTVEGVVYRLATPDDTEAIWQLLAAEFYPRTALCHCLEMKLPEDVLILRSFLPDIINQGVSLVAVDATSGQLVGARPSTVEHQNAAHQKHPLVEDAKLAAQFAKCSTVYRMFDHLSGQVDLFQHYGVNRAIVFKFLVVSASHSGRGIAKTLVRLSLQLARDANLGLAVTCAASPISERIYQALGFDRLWEIDLAAFVDPLTRGKPFAGIRQEELKFAVLFAKRV